MPGMTLQMSSTRIDLESFRKAQAAMQHADDYQATVEMSQPGIAAGKVAYSEYPISFTNFSKGVLVIEGRIYDADLPSAQRSVLDIAERIVAGENSTALVRDWVSKHDGEYIVAILAPEAKAAFIFNDALGRLPFFYRSTRECFLASRECKFILRAAGDFAIDPLGWAECLCIEHPFAGRTLFAGISRIQGGTLLRINYDAGVELIQTKAFQLNFEDDSFEHNIGAREIATIVEAFVDGARLRGAHPDSGTKIVSLSGGQDSRAAASALVSAGINCEAVSFAVADGRGAPDARIAARIAAQLNIPWQRINLPSPTSADEQRLIFLRDGHNCIENALLLPFMEKITERWGRRATYVTGDGGNVIMGTTLANLTKGIFKGQLTCVAPGAAERLMQLEPGTLQAEIKQALSGYPEKDPIQRAAHFIIFERSNRYLAEGEDRARCFMWQTSPFYGLRFFQHAMRVPPAQKKHYRFYQAFQRQLSRACSTIPDSNYGIPLGSSLFIPLLKARQGTPTVLKRALGKYVPGVRRRPFVVPAGAMAQLEELSLHAPVSQAVGRALLPTLDGSEFFIWSTLVELHKSWRSQQCGCNHAATVS